MVQDDSVIDLARSAAFRLGPLHVDPPLRRVSTGETLEPRVMQVLVALARANGAVVSRDALIASCWDGRIVGEDSITRVIGRLRKLADETGDGTFRIETVPKVGYRLVGMVEPIVSAPAPAFAALPLAASAPASRRWPFAALALALIAVATFATWRTLTPRDDPAMIQFTGFRPLTPALAGVAQTIADATRSAFTEDGVVGITTANGPFRLGGSLTRDATTLRLTVRIDATSSGATLWSKQFERDAASPQAAKWFASQTTGIARCGLSRLVGAGTVPDEALRLVFSGCAIEAGDGSPDRALDMARTLTGIAPTLASGWSTRGFIADGMANRSPPAVASALRREARMAIDKAIALDPQDSRAWHARIYFVPAADIVARERAFLAATRARLSDCACVFVEYGQFLLGVGRAADARRMFQRARDVAPLHPAPLAGLGRINAGEGRVAEAKAVFAAIDSLADAPDYLTNVLVSNALWTRDYADAVKLMQSLPPFGPPEVSAAIVAGFRALASGDPVAEARAAAVLEPVAARCKCNGAFNVRMLAALGATDAAFRQLEELARRRPEPALEAVTWDPVFADVRRLPGFASLTERLGLIRYWRATKTRPDICAAGNAPPVCATI